MKLHKKIISVITAAAVAVCTLAASLTFASAVVTISDGVFEYTYNNESNSWILYSYLGEDSEITLPQNFYNSPVTGINSRCFAYSGVTDVTVPEGYTYIGDYAFSDCENLSTISLPSTVSQIDMGAFYGSGLTGIDLSQTKIKFISSYCFKNCKSLESALLPEGITSIGYSAFYGTALTDIAIPEGVTVIGDGAFYDAKSLGDVSLPESLKTIGESSFENSALTSVDLPDGLESIGSSAFRSCSSLEDIFIPTSVNSIGGYALFPMSIQGSVTVYCYENSYADTYCYENFIRSYITVPEVYGDSDSSGSVSIIDVTLLQQHLAGMIEIDNPLTLKLLDVDLDGTIDVNDGLIIQKHIAKIYPYLPLYV